MMLGLRNVVGIQGGIETHVRHLVEQLSKDGVSIEIIVRSPYSRKASDRLDDNILLTRIWAPRSAIGETLVHSIVSVLYAAVRRPRLLHIHAIGPGLVTPLARLLGLRVVVTHHGQDFKRERWGALGRFVLRSGERLTAAFANECIVVSSPLAKDLAEHYERPFWYIPNGVDPGRITRTQHILDALKLVPGAYVLNVGRMVPEKRQLDIIKAFQALKRDDLKLVLVGKADHESDYSKAVLVSAQADERIVIAGFRQGSELAELFSQAALFVLPSSHEGLAIAALEAMSYGLPLLVSDIPANLAIGLPAECYAKTGSIEDWVRGLHRQLDKPGAVDWSEALSHYEWRDVANKTLDVYRLAWCRARKAA